METSSAIGFSSEIWAVEISTFAVILTSSTCSACTFSLEPCIIENFHFVNFYFRTLVGRNALLFCRNVGLDELFSEHFIFRVGCYQKLLVRGRALARALLCRHMSVGYHNFALHEITLLFCKKKVQLTFHDQGNTSEKLFFLTEEFVRFFLFAQKTYTSLDIFLRENRGVEINATGIYTHKYRIELTTS